MHRIADTGLIVALINRKDPYHAWAADQAGDMTDACLVRSP
jgi:hypothetical protein